MRRPFIAVRAIPKQNCVIRVLIKEVSKMKVVDFVYLNFLLILILILIYFPFFYF